MNAYTWPVLVNQTILHDGYTRAPQANVIVTTMDNGQRKMRRRSTARSIYHTITLSFERVALSDGVFSEYQLFENFVTVTLMDGIAPFWFQVPDILVTPDTYRARACKFFFDSNGTPYKIQKYFGTRTYVSFTLEELPQ